MALRRYLAILIIIVMGLKQVNMKLGKRAKSPLFEPGVGLRCWKTDLSANLRWLDAYIFQC